MTIGFVADVHAGNHRRFGGAMKGSINDRCRLVLSTFETACRKAIDAHCRAFIVLGDLLDYARPEAPLLRSIQLSLRSLKKAGCSPYLLLGNHEQTSTAQGDHALAPLAPYATVVETPMRCEVDGAELLLVPFQPGRAKDWLPRAVRGLLGSTGEPGRPLSPPRGRRVLGLHLGIRDAKTAPWLSDASDAIDVDTLSALCFEANIGYVFAGNWHDRRAWEFYHAETNATLQVLQLGALVPTGWDNPGMIGYGTLALFDGGTVTTKEIAGPRFVKVRSSKEAKIAMNDARKVGHRLFVQIEASPEDCGDFASWGAGCVARSEIAACEVIPDHTLAKEEAKNAAAAARGSDTLDEALAAYVENMPLPDHVRRDAVLNRARRYLT